MRCRFRSAEESDWPLPWQVELVFWLVGLVGVPIGMWWLTSEVTSPATMLGKMMGVTVDTQSFVEPFKPLILVFGVLFGVRVRCLLRRAILDRLNRIL